MIAFTSPTPGPPRQGKIVLDASKLLQLELEVVSLQQALQAALMEHQSRSSQIHRLQQALQDAEDRAQVCVGWRVNVVGWSD